MSDATDVRMSRARLYVLIDGFEQDMRVLVEENLLADSDPQALLTEDEFSICSRRESVDDAAASGTSLIHYLDLQTCFDVLIRNRASLPYVVADTLKTCAPQIPRLVPIRHRVMHGRPLQDEDAETTIKLLRPFVGQYWTNTQKTLKRLNRDPLWEPYFERFPVPAEKTLHNLPEVDNDETTFMGRKDEAERLIDALRRRRDPVITVTGEGGIGKTALALDVAYKLLDSEQNPYDAILWVSLKTELLTAYGVAELRNAIRGITDSVQHIGQTLDSSFEGTLGDLAEALEGIECLIIVDNLETAQGAEVVELYDTLPASVNYLFTSRLGIGQIERRFPLPPLDQSVAKLLLRRFAAARRQRAIAATSDRTMDEVVKRLRYSPLAIRWYVLSGEAGRVPLDTLRDQRELLDFCVKNVYERLAENSRAILGVLRSLDRAIAFDEFAILTDLSIDELRAVTQELTQGSLVVVESEVAGAVAGRLALTPTAREFLPRPDQSGGFIAEVLRRERQFKAAKATPDQVVETHLMFDLINMRDGNDHSAAFLLKRAVTFCRSGNYDQAHEMVNRAKRFVPEFPEVYRISGNIHTLQEHYETAVSEYQTALSYSNEPRIIATASYSLADVLSRKLHEVSLALPYARKAHEALPIAQTAVLLGKLLVWNSEFAEGQHILEDQLEDAHGRHRLVVATMLVDSWSRWADFDLRDRKIASALERSSAGFYSGKNLLATAARDSKLINAVAECVVVFLRGISKAEPDRLPSVSRFFADSSKFIVEFSWLINPRKVAFLRDAATRVAAQGTMSGPDDRSLRSMMRALEAAG